jgi:hypothetical protein
MLLKLGREREDGLKVEFDVISNQRRGIIVHDFTRTSVGVGGPQR